MIHSTTLLPALALAATAVAQVGWVQRQPATRPSSRGYHAMTYDPVRNRTVMFGGFPGGSLGDTWEWDGLDWTQRFPLLPPPARNSSALAADFSRGRVVLFGGRGSGVDLNDTWEYDGNAWTEMQPSSQPSERQNMRMEYDAARARIVLFGGGVGASGTAAFNDTWEWDGANWTQRTPANSPPPRFAHGMAYDFVRSRIVLFGGSPAFGTTPQYLSDTWTWDGTNWTQLLITPPTATSQMGFTSDAGRDLVVRFGGPATWAETWLFDHVAWRRDPRTVFPPQRSWCALAHDLLRARTMLFGGWMGSGYLDDTWEYDPGTIARWTASGSGCQGTSGVPMLRPIGASLPIVGTTFQLELLGIPGNAAAISFGFSDTQWNGGALPFGLGALGMTGCTLHASPDFLFFTPVLAGRATLAWPLPNAGSLIGVRFFNQGFVLDPGVNPTGATVSNAGAGTIGPF